MNFNSGARNLPAALLDGKLVMLGCPCITPSAVDVDSVLEAVSAHDENWEFMPIFLAEALEFPELYGVDGVIPITIVGELVHKLWDVVGLWSGS
jgi:hypothetical protein